MSAAAGALPTRGGAPPHYTVFWLALKPREHTLNPFRHPQREPHEHTLTRVCDYSTPQLLPYELIDRMKDSVNCDVCGRRCFPDTRKRTIVPAPTPPSVRPHFVPCEFVLCSDMCLLKAHRVAKTA